VAEPKKVLNVQQLNSARNEPNVQQQWSAASKEPQNQNTTANSNEMENQRHTPTNPIEPGKDPSTTNDPGTFRRWKAFVGTELLSRCAKRRTNNHKRSARQNQTNERTPPYSNRHKRALVGTQ
jgi:hypothetical protein